MRWLSQRAGSLLLGLLAGGCREAARRPPDAIETVALPAPQGVESAFEPHVAVDPNRPDRIVVAAQYGAGYNRGGRHIWIWTTGDGGTVWNGSDLPLPKADAVLAADPVTAFDGVGRGLVAFLFADSAFHGGAAVSATGPNDLNFGPAEVVVRDRLAEGGGAVDKDWLAIDRSRTSPLAGAVYFSWHYNRPLPDHSVESILWLRSTRGRGWSEPVQVAPHFGGQLAIRSTGALDAVFVGRDERTLLHAESEAGGGRFTSPDTLATVSDSEAIDLPTVGMARGDTLVVCWGEGPKSRSSGYRVRCVRRTDGGQRLGPATVDTAAATLGFPAVAITPEAIWVLAYQSDTAATAVRLYRSSDGARTFARQAVLATRAFGIDRFCPAAVAPCRRTLDPAMTFFPGDYVGLSAAPDRVVATFTLPEQDTPGDRSTVYVSVVPANAP